jgi:putative solute:sodium symporter small subunit
MAVVASENKAEHWRRTRRLMIIHILIWFVFAYLVHWFAGNLNAARFIGFPLGYYMAAQGSLFAFVIQLFIFVKQQDKIDRDCGVAE